MGELIKDVLKILGKGKALFYFVIFFVVIAGYLYLVNETLISSAIFAFVASIISIYFLMYLSAKRDREHLLMKDLQKYATSMSFYLQSGQNVYYSLIESKRGLDKEVQDDIQLLAESLPDFDADHFKKYKFSAINIFNQILKIKYDKGGDPTNLFTNINDNVNFEITKRDELYRKKIAIQNQVYVMMGMVLSFPLIFKFLAGRGFYEHYLDMGIIASGLNMLLLALMLISLFLLKRNTTDVSIG